MERTHGLVQNADLFAQAGDDQMLHNLVTGATVVPLGDWVLLRLFSASSLPQGA